MSYWIGSYGNIVAAEALAAALVVGRPEECGGVVLPPAQWITDCWAEPRETAESGVWAIKAHPDLPTPEGCTEVGSVVWPQEPEG